MFNYADVIYFSGTWGLVFLVAAFLSVFAFVFWPKNRAKFDEASMLVFNEDLPETEIQNRKGEVK